MKKLIASLLFISLSLPGQAFSQTTQATDPNLAVALGNVATGEITPISNIVSRVSILTSIPANTPVAIDLGSLTIPGVDSNLTRGVTVKAYTRYVEYQGRKIGQIVLVGLEKNGRFEALPTDGYSAQFELDNPSLDPAKEILVKGDASPLIAALRVLDEPVQQVPAAQDAVVAQDNNNAQKQDGNSPTQQNDPAAAYKTPDAVNVDSPVESSRVTTDGCSVRPDFASMRAIQQSKSVTMSNGTITSETECSDSFDSVPITPSYVFCPYVEDVDPAVRTATAQFELIYIDVLGNRQPVKPEGQAEQCAPDPEKIFPITEKACNIFLDYQKLEAVSQSSLVYMDDNNREVQVRGCQASETKPAVPMEATTIGCGIRDDFSLNKSFQLGTHTYLLDGISYQAGGCSDTGTEYTHTQAYTDVSGKALCSPVLDANNRPTALQSRISITVGGLPKYITICAPDTAGTSVTATTVGCENPALWTHDLNTAQSFGQERFYFVDGGQEVRITECQSSQTTFEQFPETVGWQPHDDLLYAFPLSTVYIIAPTGRYDVLSNQVLSGATQMPYQLTGTSTQTSGTPTYPANDCNQYQPTENVELWKRPDTTIYPKSIGPGALIGPTYACSGRGAETSTDWVATGAPGHSWSGQQWMTATSCWARSSQVYRATRELVRADGTVISSVIGNYTVGSAAGSSWAPQYYSNSSEAGYYCRDYSISHYGTPPANLATSYVATARNTVFAW